MSDAVRGSVTTVRVEIAGSKYTLRTDANEAYTRRCAAMVDERMRQIGGQAHMDARKTAIMAALSLADDLLHQQDKFREQTQALTGRIEEALADPRSGESG